MLRWLALFFLFFTVQAGPTRVITTWGIDGFSEATKVATNILGDGGDRMAALVKGLSKCEDLGCDTTVGSGGSPDESGETVLDALVIDSVGMDMGAVANLHRISSAAEVAYHVMKYTKHTLLVGEAATQFAIQQGFPEKNLSSPASVIQHNDWVKGNCQPNFRRNVSPDPLASCGPYKPSETVLIQANKHGMKKTRNVTIDEMHHDTIGMVVIDSTGHIAAGTSTNGAKFKVPGRVGDSPIPGAGAYARDQVGGAAATGDGDILMRFLPSFKAVEHMAEGTSPKKACKKAMEHIRNLYPGATGAIVCVNVRGDIGAACVGLDEFHYAVGYPETKQIKILTVKCIKQHI